MITQSRPEQRLRAQQWKASLQRQTYRVLTHKPATKVRKTVVLPTASERQFVILGFMLGALSIFCGFFPICGLPIAISGLIIGLNSRHIRPLQRMVAWAVVLSLIGLFLALANSIISISIYLTYYLWQ